MASDQLPTGDQQVLWDFDGLTSSGVTLDFDLKVTDLNLGESRPVASRAQILFANSFTEEIITADIVIPHVEAVSQLLLSSEMDQTTISSDTDVAITTTIQNQGPDFEGGTLQLIVRAEGYPSNLDALDPLVVDSLIQNEVLMIDQTWNTGTLLAGHYVVIGQLLTASSQVLSESTTPFSITATSQDGEGAPLIEAQVFTDSQQYGQYDGVNITSRVLNTATNVIQPASMGQLRVTGPTGEPVYAVNRAVPQLVSGELTSRSDVLALNTLAAGDYTVNWQVLDAAGETQLGSASSQFTLMYDTRDDLVGDVTTSTPQRYVGDSISCEDTVTNRSPLNEASFEVRQLIVNLDDGLVVQSAAAQQSLMPGTSVTLLRAIDTAGFAPGAYACTLEIAIADERRHLGFAGIQLEVPPIQLSVTHSQEGRGRLLILMDALAEQDELDLTANADQANYLRAVLDAEQWSYTIVHNEADFRDAFYSGQYALYGLFSNRVTLSPWLEQVLVEAVHQGEGLVISGAFNRRNNKLEKALGIAITGRQYQSAQVLIPAGQLGEGSAEAILEPKVMLDIDSCSAMTLAHYIDPVKPKGKAKTDCEELLADHPAVTAQAYGLGKNTFIAFDALDHATALGTLENSYADLLRFALNDVHPQSLSTAGDALPLLLAVENEGMAVHTRLILSEPTGGSILGTQAGWQWIDETEDEGYWQYQATLAEEANFDASLYIQLAGSSPFQVTLHVEVSADGETWALYEEQTLSIDPDQVEIAIGDVLADLQALKAFSGDKAIGHAIKQIELALGSRDIQEYEEAIQHLVQAVGYLDEVTYQSQRLALDRVLLGWVREIADTNQS